MRESSLAVLTLEGVSVTIRSGSGGETDGSIGAGTGAFDLDAIECVRGALRAVGA